MTCIAELDDYSEFFLKILFILNIFLLCGLFQTGLFEGISAEVDRSFRLNVQRWIKSLHSEQRVRNRASHPP